MLKPRYHIPSRKYFHETVILGIVKTVEAKIKTKLGNWNSRKTGTGAGTESRNRNLQKSLSDSLPVKFTELCKSSHKYSIVVKFFVPHNKRQPAQNSISTDAIHDLLRIMLQLFKPI